MFSGPLTLGLECKITDRYYLCQYLTGSGNLKQGNQLKMVEKATNGFAIFQKIIDKIFVTDEDVSHIETCIAN